MHDVHFGAPTHYLLNTAKIGTSTRNAATETSLPLAGKTKAVLVEPFLVAKVVLCWIVGLPIFALCFSGMAIWDHAVSWSLRVTNGQGRSVRFARPLPARARVQVRAWVR